MKKKAVIDTLPDKHLTKEVLSDTLQSRLAFRQTWVDRVAELMTREFGTVWFLIANIVIFILWILWNEGFLGLTPFDPFPYSLLTMAVSLEAIVLSIIVLISQNRQGHVAEVREKLDFEIDVRAEQEITKILCILEDMEKHFGMERKKDGELEEMKKRVNLETLRKTAESEG